MIDPDPHLRASTCGAPRPAVAASVSRPNLLGRVSPPLARALECQSSDFAWSVVPSPGEAWLDVGCGEGRFAIALKVAVGSQGRAVGVDLDTSQIARADQRSRRQRTAVEFVVGDATSLPFDDRCFDGCCCERVFQHLSNRERALREMLRVTKPGGWICVSDPDWDTLMIDAPNRDLTRKIVGHTCDQLRNGWSGRELPRLFCNAGLMPHSVLAGSLVLTDFNMADELYALRASARRLGETGAAPIADIESWVSSLEQASANGQFFCCMTGLTVTAQKPPRSGRTRLPTTPPGTRPELDVQEWDKE